MTTETAAKVAASIIVTAGFLIIRHFFYKIKKTTSKTSNVKQRVEKYSKHKDRSEKSGIDVAKEAEQLLKKSKLLDESLEIGVISKDEYDMKLKDLYSAKNSLKRIKEIEDQLQKIEELYKANLLTKDQYNNKRKNLRKEKNELTQKSDTPFKNVKYYYTLNHREYGPYSINHIRHLYGRENLNLNARTRAADSDYSSGLTLRDLLE